MCRVRGIVVCDELAGLEVLKGVREKGRDLSHHEEVVTNSSTKRGPPLAKLIY